MIRLNTSQELSPPIRLRMTVDVPIRLKAGVKAIPHLPFPRMMEDLQDALGEDERIRLTNLA